MLRYPATSSVLMQRLQAILAGDYSRVTGNPETNPEVGFLQVEILLNQIWVFSPDGWQRILIATKQNAPLDNNPSLVLKGDVLCTANLGFTHAKPEEADRTVVCVKGFPLPK
jgi:hypothetical protein